MPGTGLGVAMGTAEDQEPSAGGRVWGQQPAQPARKWAQQPQLGLVGYLVIVFSRYRQRIGDHAVGTVVVRASVTR